MKTTSYKIFLRHFKYLIKEYFVLRLKKKSYLSERDAFTFFCPFIPYRFTGQPTLATPAAI